MRFAVFASGDGTVFESIAHYARRGVLRGAELVLLLSNRPSSGAVNRARSLGIETEVVTTKRPDGTKKDRFEFEGEVIEVLRSYGVEFCFLAGWNKILDLVVDEYPYRIMNTHPSLLPAFAGLYGLDVHRAVLERGCKVTGCTIHFVDKGVDTGPIVLQRAVEVSDEDTVETLAEKVKALERRLAPMAIQLYRDGRVSLVERFGRLIARTDLSGGWLEEWLRRERELLGVDGEGT
ncbi:MAG: phosphoribosylglycinamide formyltransferase [Nitrososphaerota archaeon]